MTRLFVNRGAYHGECIDIEAVLREASASAAAHGWRLLPILVAPGFNLPAFERRVPEARNTLYISSGIHGDEPAGPLAVQRLLAEADWPAHTDVWIVPCLNPAGFRLKCREDEAGVDLNRDYLARQTALVRAHIAWLNQRPRFDLSLLLHEDWEAHGFYLYELNTSPTVSFATTIIEGVRRVCPVDDSPLIEGREASGGIIRVKVDLQSRQDWPEAFYLVSCKTPMNYTLESPSDFALETRTQALVEGVRAALGQLS